MIVYTDSSLSDEEKNTSCALFILGLDYTKSWLLSPGSSIFTDELQGIKDALSFIYNSDTIIPEACIISDSISAFKAIASHTSSTNNDCVSSIRNILECLKSSGAKIQMAWVSSHIRIERNERADKLVVAECASPSGNLIQNDLLTSEKLINAKAEWKSGLLTLFQLNCVKSCVQLRVFKPALFKP